MEFVSRNAKLLHAAASSKIEHLLAERVEKDARSVLRKLQITRIFQVLIWRANEEAVSYLFVLRDE